ncbi:PAS domain-containing protein [Flavobacterium selenitireducens]|uniref:PAS domain-containing protein n=1 Tax=Flavobacterium selenitireducens TaxID=2722704 RepID=UPI00168BDCC6|nr:PAS domain-containing protein [Flavobacterium selenitireducens]MBD3583004.1 PAS domain-containing protein [Flavobacterium selenitireducens]
MNPDPIDYRRVFNSMPGASGLLLPNAPEFTIVASTQEFAEFAGADRQELIGSSLFQFFPDNPDAPIASSDIRESLAKCLETKRKNELPVQRYDLVLADGAFHEMYWTVIHTPILDEDGNVRFIIHTAVNKSDAILAQKQDETLKTIAPAYNLFKQSNMAIHIFMGEDMRVTFANDRTLEFWKRDESVIGKPLLEIFPELAEQDYPNVIRSVRETGITKIYNDKPAVLSLDGVDTTVYVDVIFQAFYEEPGKKPVGVVAMVADVTQAHNSKLELAEKERTLELAVEIGDLGVFNINPQTKEINYSPQIMEWFGVDRSNLSLADLLKKIHPEDVPIVGETLRQVVSDNNPRHDITFRVPDIATGKVRYLRSIGQLQIEEGNAVALSGIIQDVSNIIRSRHEIEQSEQRLRSVIAAAPFPIGIYIGREMRVAVANKALTDVWGKGPDVVGKTYYECLPELADTGVYENLDAVYMSGKPYDAYNQLVQLVVNGQLQSFYFNYSFTPLFDAQENVYGVLNTAADVTDLFLAKAEVEQSEDRYRTLIEKSSVAAALYLGRDLKIQYANGLMLDYWGKDASAIGKVLEEAVPELQDQPFIGFLREVFDSGKEYSGEQEVAVLDVGNGPEEFYFNYTYKPLRDADGTIYGIHHMAIDVTTVVVSQKRVEESERNFRNMILQAPVAICILRGPDHVFDNVNHMMEELTGRKASEMEGKSIFEGLPEIAGNGLEPILNDVYHNKVSFLSDEQEFQLLHDGKLEPSFIRYIYEPMLDTMGNTEGIMVVASDVTHQVRARRKIEEIVAQRTQELELANQALQKSNAELEQFAYIASHDLQEPLRKISLFTQMLESSLGELNDRARFQMDRINNSVGRMTALIRDILGFSQLSRSHDPFVRTDLNGVFEEAMADFDIILQEKSGQVINNGLCTLEAIPLQMTQLFHNLISNSLKYSRADVPPVITISTAMADVAEIARHKLPENDSGYCKLSFRDNGIGFRQEYAERIFQIFQRLHGKTQFEGTGIGLAMCKKIAENHKGIIYAVGHEGEGAEFVVLLPIEQPEIH